MPPGSFIDGDFLKWDSLCKVNSKITNTQKEVEKFLIQRKYIIRDLREQLEKEKKEEFEKTQIYDMIKAEYGKKYPDEIPLPFGRVPTATVKSAKHGIEWSAKKYVEGRYNEEGDFIPGTSKKFGDYCKIAKCNLESSTTKT